MKKFIAWIKEYSRTLIRSVSDVGFYRTLADKRPADAIGHLVVAVAVFWMAPLLIAFFTVARSGIEEFHVGLRAHVPAGTVFELKKGAFTNTLESPIVLRRDKAVVIVNTATSTLALADDEVGVILTAEGIVQKKSEAVTETVKWSSLPDFSTTKERIDEWAEDSAKWMLLVAAIAVTVGAAVSFAVAYGIMTAFHGFLYWFLVRRLKRPVSYASAFTVAAYAATLPLVLKSLLFWLEVDGGILPTVLYWILLGFIVYDGVKGGTEHESGRKETDVHGSGQDRADSR